VKRIKCSKVWTFLLVYRGMFWAFEDVCQCHLPSLMKHDVLWKNSTRDLILNTTLSFLIYCKLCVKPIDSSYKVAFVFIVIVNMVFTCGICMCFFFFSYDYIIWVFFLKKNLVHVNLMLNEKIVNITFSWNVDFSWKN
jgi:hypothetical protein